MTPCSEVLRIHLAPAASHFHPRSSSSSATLLPLAHPHLQRYVLGAADFLSDLSHRGFAFLPTV